MIAGSFFTAYPGSDLSHYNVWSQKILSANIQQRKIKEYGQIKELPDRPSVQGVQFSHWSIAPGLLISTVRWIFEPLNQGDLAFRLIGFLSITIFWTGFFSFVQRLTSESMAGIGVLLLFINSSIGFYSCHFALENYTLLPVGVLLNEASKRIARQPVSCLAVGTATGMLLMMRPFLAAYSWCVLVPELFSRSKDESIKNAMINRAFLTLPIFLAIWQVGTVHFWMTGNFFRSPYSFGDPEFASIDWSCPYLSKVLFSPFHGILVYHPLLLLGGFLTAGLILKRNKEGRLLLFIWLLLLATLVNLYFAGCWHNWWMAGWFGNRNAYLPGILPIFAIIWAIHNRLPSRNPLAIIVFVFATSIWSFALLQRGCVSYNEYRFLFLDWAFDVNYWGQSHMIFVLLFSAVISYLVSNGLPLENVWSRSLFGFLLTLTLAYFADRLVIQNATEIVLLGLLSSICAILFLVERLPIFASKSVPVLFVASLILFMPLFFTTQSLLHENNDGIRYPDYDLIYNLEMTKGCRIIAAERNSMLQFLRREKGEEWFREFAKQLEKVPVQIIQRSYPSQKITHKNRYN